MSDQKTEDPTDRKLEQARDEGMAPKSQDLVDAIGFLACVACLMVGGSQMLERARSLMRTSLAFVAGPHGDETMMTAMWDLLRAGLSWTFPVLAAAGMAAAIAIAAQVKVRPSMKAAMPKLQHLNPVGNLTRMISIRSTVDLTKSMVKALAFGWIGTQAIMALLPTVLNAVYQPPLAIGWLAWRACIRLCQIWLLVYLLIGTVDLLLQRRLYTRDQRMTKDEVKRENKDDSGDPVIKQERRSLHRALGAERPSTARGMAQATALVTNPTHYAVALRYDPQACPVPVVVASGVDEEAAVLRRLAGDYGVPIVANPPLARALYRVSPGGTIPEPLFEAVAAVLRWVRAMGPRPSGASATEH